MIRRGIEVAVLIGMVGGVIAGTAATASASCVAPSLQVSTAAVAPGQRIAVSGTGFFTGPCNDTVTDPPTPTVPDTPTTGIEIVFKQGSRETVLANVDADSTYRFTVSVGIPTDAGVGAAAIVARAATGDIASADVVVAAVGGGPPELARTGGRNRALVVAGFGFVAAGLLLRPRRPNYN